MTPQDLLSELSDLLGRERRAIKKGEIDELISIGERKADLVRSLEELDEPLPPSLDRAAWQVRRFAHMNSFLIKDLGVKINAVGLESFRQSLRPDDASTSSETERVSFELDHLEPACPDL